jgi:hypothetical protein
MELIVRLTTSWLMERHIDIAKGLVYLSMENTRLPLTHSVEGYPRFISPDCGENNDCDGFF